MLLNRHGNEQHLYFWHSKQCNFATVWPVKRHLYAKPKTGQKDNMKHFLTIFLLLFTFGLFAQPANDDCSGILDLGVAPSCDSTLYNNIGASESNIGTDNYPDCFVGIPARDVWFQFTATADFLDYRIEVAGCEDTSQVIQAMSNPQIAIYRGDCEFDGLQLLDCVSATAGDNTVFMDLIGLTPNITYFLRINDWSSTGDPNDGAFKLCVREKPPISTVDQGGSTECSGTLTDSGGEFGDYGADENYVFTICPSQPHECILFTMQYYNIEYSGDQIYLYDGPNISSPLIGNISGEGSSPTPNEGGVCYAVSASSGCLTVKFSSDATVNFEGFLANWECTTEACPEPAEMIVDTDADQEQIVASVISGQTLISLVEVDCANGAVGTFTVTDDTDLGMDKGLVLSTGSVMNIPQPATNFASTVYCGLNCTDTDLNTLSLLYGNGQNAQDACIVEMDVLAASEELTFEYVFGSEEYPDFISPNTFYNDIFAFLVSGPGIVGDPNINNKLNVATLPDGTFIQIEDVNQSDNWQYYRDNSTNQSIVYGGMTSDSLGVKKSLTARVPTIPCETYKLKFAIADRGDSSFDSGVFISKINSGTPELSVDFQNGIDYLVESCTNVSDQVVISFNNPIDNPQTYNIVIGGSAELGVDYELDMPSTILFETGTEIFTFPLTVLTDVLVEGIDSIEISLVRDFGCGALVVSTIILEIHDNIVVEVVNAEQDTIILCASAGCIPLEVTGAQTYSWSPDTLFNDPTSGMPIICTQTSQWVYVQGELGVCNDVDSVYINVIDIEVSIVPDVDNIEICEGESLTVLAQNNVNNQNLQWSTIFNSLPNPTNPEQEIIDDFGIGFESATVRVEVGGCIATDNIVINWVPFDVPTLIDDITICQNSTVQLANEVATNSTTYVWSPDIALSPSANVSGPFATPDVTTTYTLISTAGSGANSCHDTSSVTITIIPADVDIAPADTAFICVGESITLTNTNTTNGVGVTWSPTDFLTEVSTEEAIVSPPLSQYYYATLVTPDCVVTDSVWVQVDSLPDLSIMADPMKDSYCQGEEIYLISPTYEPAHFPSIDPMWIPNQPGAQTPDSFLNLVIIALEDFTYTRTTTVNACTSVDSIFIDVVPVTSISIVPADTTVCQGEQVQFTIEGPAELTEFTWMPADGLSCTDCREPLATVFASTTYQVEAEFEGCPVGASASINVPAQFFQYTGPNPICPGTIVLLNNANVPGATYSWTSSDGSLTSSEPQPTVTPAQTTTYNLVASIGNCTFETALTIQVQTNFELTVAPVGISCPGNGSNNDVNLSASANPDSPIITYIWTNTGTGIPVTGNNITVNPQATANWQLVASDVCFTNTVDFVVEVAPVFNISVTPLEDNVIAGIPSTFTVDASLAGIDFEWSEIPDGIVVGNGESITVVNCESQQYQVTATDFNDCTQTAIATQFVQDAFMVNPPIIVTSNGDTLFMEGNQEFQDSIFEGQEVEMLADVNPLISGSTYIWIVNADTVAVTNEPSSGVFYLPEVPFDIESFFEVIVVSPIGCNGTNVATPFIYNNPVEAPNVFTPNGDNVNDYFTLISLVPVEILDFRIWNRWGKMVYDGENGLDGWDGMIDGKAAASDVYIYSITYQIPGSDNPLKPLKGDVTLLR